MTASKVERKLLERPVTVWLLLGSSIYFLPVRMCRPRFTAVTGTIITKPTLIQQINLTSLTLDILFCEHLATSKLKPTISGVYGSENEITESQRRPIPVYHS